MKDKEKVAGNFVFATGVTGMVLVVIGAATIWGPLGWIAGGVFMLLLSYAGNIVWENQKGDENDGSGAIGQNP